MSLESAVDLSTAVIAYRPAAGEERSVPAEKVSPAALLLAAPWRTFRWYFGQRHYSGTYWSATQRDHVIYESRLELANLLLADFDRCRGLFVQEVLSSTMWLLKTSMRLTGSGPDGRLRLRRQRSEEVVQVETISPIDAFPRFVTRDFSTAFAES